MDTSCSCDINIYVAIAYHRLYDRYMNFIQLVIRLTPDEVTALLLVLISKALETSQSTPQFKVTPSRNTRITFIYLHSHAIRCYLPESLISLTLRCLAGYYVHVFLIKDLCQKLGLSSALRLISETMK